MNNQRETNNTQSPSDGLAEHNITNSPMHKKATPQPSRRRSLHHKTEDSKIKTHNKTIEDTHEQLVHAYTYAPIKGKVKTF